jgi:hypothetical protein
MVINRATERMHDARCGESRGERLLQIFSEGEKSGARK